MAIFGTNWLYKKFGLLACTVKEGKKKTENNENRLKMDEDTVFLRRACEAVTTVSLNIEDADPVIRELLNRLRAETSKLRDLPYVDTNIVVGPSDSGLIPTTSSHGINTGSNRLGLSGYTAGTPGDVSAVTGDLATATSKVSSSSLERENDKRSHKKPKARKKSASEKEEKFPCSKCELVFTRAADLVRHERAHSLVLPNICSRCGKVFARKDALKRHFDTLTCRRNRRRLIEITNGKFEEFLERATREGISL